MRPLPPALADHLATGATTLAWCWRVVRRDGAVFGFTDHDRDLAFEGVTFRAGEGWSAGEAERGLGLSIDSATVLGALTGAAVRETDVLAGRWDGAEVAAFRVNWADVAQRVRLWTGRIGRIVRRDSAFEAEILGLQAALNATIGRVYSRFCDADLGDARCGVDLDLAGRRATGTVTTAAGALVQVAGLGGLDPAGLARGQARVLTGAAAGESRTILSARPEGAGLMLELHRPLAIAPAPGDSLRVTVGCDKTLETCRQRFANALNFQGFPHMPGNDALAAGPPASGLLDGGRR
jgi:uncharacterized phage protein (TIGR02218 family)